MAARSFPNTVAAVAAARRFALDHVSGISVDVEEELLVMVSELTTNSVRHTRTTFTLEVDQSASEIYVAVTDTGPGNPTLRHPAPTESSGRGLQIVGALAHDWGVTHPSGDGGKTVWFKIQY